MLGAKEGSDDGSRGADGREFDEIEEGVGALAAARRRGPREDAQMERGGGIMVAVLRTVEETEQQYELRFGEDVGCQRPQLDVRPTRARETLGVMLEELDGGIEFAQYNVA